MTRRGLVASSCALALSSGLGCAPGTELLRIDAQPVCDAPVAGFARFTEEGAQRGLAGIQGEAGDVFNLEVAGLVARDLDGDGDIDLALQQATHARLLANDGDGYFQEVPLGVDTRTALERDLMALGAVDLTDDGLPELLFVGLGFLAWSENLGGLAFGPLQTLWWSEEPATMAAHSSIAWADLDADGDLDLILPGMEDYPEVEDGPPHGSPDLLFEARDGAFLPQGGFNRDRPAIALLALPTDIDDDGDLDVLMGTDRPRPPLPPMSLLINQDPAPAAWADWADESETHGTDLRASAMGIASADLNRDGRLDYCLTDIANSVRCLLSEAAGFVEGGLQLGLRGDFAALPGASSHPEYTWVGWSLELDDLDNDGWRDAVASAGNPALVDPSGTAEHTWQPNLMWQGGPAGFIDQTASVGFGSTGQHHGLATADFDGDGFRDVVLTGHLQPVELWMNRCSDQGWLEIGLAGPAGNRAGYGARVLVAAGAPGQVPDQSELYGPRAAGQGPAALHFGLGDRAQVPWVEVRWPDGAVSRVGPVPARSRITILHPDEG